MLQRFSYVIMRLLWRRAVSACASSFYRATRTCSVTVTYDQDDLLSRIDDVFEFIVVQWLQLHAMWTHL